MEAGCENIEVIGTVVTRARITLRYTSSLEVDVRKTTFDFAQNVLALYEE